MTDEDIAKLTMPELLELIQKLQNKEVNSKCGIYRKLL